MSEFPPYTCPVGEVVIPAVEIFNADGSLLNAIVCSACDMAWYVQYQEYMGNPGCTWRVRADYAAQFPDVIGTHPADPPPVPEDPPPPVDEPQTPVG